MLSHLLRSVVLGGWIASLTLIVVVSIAMEANASTTALLVALDVAPALVALLIAGGAPSPSVAEILYSVEATDSRVMVRSRALGVVRLDLRSPP